MSRPNREEARVLGSHAPQAVFGLAFRSVCVVILHPALAAAYASGEGCAPIALLWDRIMCLRAVCCGCYDGNGSPDWCALCLCALLSSVDPIPPPLLTGFPSLVGSSASYTTVGVVACSTTRPTKPTAFQQCRSVSSPSSAPTLFSTWTFTHGASCCFIPVSQIHSPPPRIFTGSLVWQVDVLGGPGL